MRRHSGLASAPCCEHTIGSIECAPALHTTKRGFVRIHVYVVACVLLISGCATESLEWQRRTKNDFPARVDMVITRLGNVLDEKRGLQYGPWTLMSGEGGPVATYECPPDGICEIMISNLQCEHTNGDRASCELILYKNAICELAVTGRRKVLEIQCPTEVALKPKGKGETAPFKEAAASAAAAAAAGAAAKGGEEAGAVRPPPGAKAPEEAATAAPEAKEAAAQKPPAAPSEQAKGQSVAGDFVFGLRAGLVVPTQQILENVSSGTSVGPLVNLEGYYSLREWVRLGMMFEWHQYDISSGDAQLGTLSTYSLLPVVEFRPTRDIMRNVGFEWVVPYASLGAGVNLHSFSNATRLANDPLSFPTTFAFRVAGGLDFPITSYLAVNGEVAWKTDSGNFDVRGVQNNFNASPLMFLFGLRVHF
jgi:outer membrane protein